MIILQATISSECTKQRNLKVNYVFYNKVKQLYCKETNFSYDKIKSPSTNAGYNCVYNIPYPWKTYCYYYLICQYKILWYYTE